MVTPGVNVQTAPGFFNKKDLGYLIKQIKKAIWNGRVS